ncbi:hypothetical protein ACLB2K_065887 [Fragaria x ananassa]
MSDHNPIPAPTSPDSIARPVGGTEYTWCKAVPVSTGITVLALLLTKPPNIPLLQNALHNLQNSHPILRSNLHFDSATSSFSFLIPPSPHLQIQPFDIPSMASILRPSSAVSPFHQILEHELNLNTWRNPHPPSADTDTGVFFASTYAERVAVGAGAPAAHVGMRPRGGGGAAQGAVGISRRRRRDRDGNKGKGGGYFGT